MIKLFCFLEYYDIPLCPSVTVNREFAEKLTKFPLRAVMIDGSFEDVCTDRQDDAAAVNIKKGILSSLQNSLPSNSSLNDGIEVEEVSAGKYFSEIYIYTCFEYLFQCLFIIV